MNSLLCNYGTFDSRTNYVIVDEYADQTLDSGGGESSSSSSSSSQRNRYLTNDGQYKVFENAASDARDHCANERNFLSWLRLSSYLAVVSVAIITSFHFNSKPSQLEREMAYPLGIVFWVLSMLCLFTGMGNYLLTIRQYSKKVAVVQTGWRTQMLGGIVSFTVIASCVIFLVQNGVNSKNDSD